MPCLGGRLGVFLWLLAVTPPAAEAKRGDNKKVGVNEGASVLEGKPEIKAARTASIKAGLAFEKAGEAYYDFYDDEVKEAEVIGKAWREAAEYARDAASKAVEVSLLLDFEASEIALTWSQIAQNASYIAGAPIEDVDEHVDKCVVSAETAVTAAREVFPKEKVVRWSGAVEARDDAEPARVDSKRACDAISAYGDFYDDGGVLIRSDWRDARDLARNAADKAGGFAKAADTARKSIEEWTSIKKRFSEQYSAWNGVRTAWNIIAKKASLLAIKTPVVAPDVLAGQPNSGSLTADIKKCVAAAKAAGTAAKEAFWRSGEAGASESKVPEQD